MLLACTCQRVSPPTSVPSMGVPHRRRHRRPSRSMSRSAAAGPQVPASYGWMAPSARSVPGLSSVPALPHAVERRDDAPGGLHLVRAGEQRRIAQHRVEDQRLVRLRGVAQERRAVREVHVHGADIEAQPGHLGREAEQDALVGLDAHRQQVRLRGAGRVPEQHQRRLLELDRDLRGAPGQALADPQVEGHVRPAPVLDLEPERHERLHRRGRRYLRLLE